jgi:hypothetical protein
MPTPFDSAVPFPLPNVALTLLKISACLIQQSRTICSNIPTYHYQVVRNHSAKSFGLELGALSCGLLRHWLISLCGLGKIAFPFGTSVSSPQVEKGSTWAPSRGVLSREDSRVRPKSETQQSAYLWVSAMIIVQGSSDFLLDSLT